MLLIHFAVMTLWLEAINTYSLVLSSSQYVIAPSHLISSNANNNGA